MILQVFDFDNTLVATNDKPLTNEAARIAGWNGKDWWGSKCSLQTVEFHENIKQHFENARNDPNIRTAMLTGRRGPIAWRIREILREAGLPGRRIIPQSNQLALKHFNDRRPEEKYALHEEFFTGDFITEDNYPKGLKGKPIDNTLTCKTFIIQQWLMNDKINQIELWDDRKEHIQPMLQLLKELLKKWNTLTLATLHQIFPEPHVVNPYFINHCFKKSNGKIETFVQNGI